MFKYSETSRKRLSECHEDLQRLFNEIIKDHDVTIVTGYRGQEEQDKAFADGRSLLKFPHGKHNQLPSKAVDFCPSPYDWDKDSPPIRFLAEAIKLKADQMGIKVSYGGDWTGFKDTDHIELLEDHHG